MRLRIGLVTAHWLAWLAKSNWFINVAIIEDKSLGSVDKCWRNRLGVGLSLLACKKRKVAKWSNAEAQLQHTVTSTRSNQRRTVFSTIRTVGLQSFVSEFNELIEDDAVQIH